MNAVMQVDERDLEQVEVRWPDDPLHEPGLFCTRCESWLCDVEHEDTLRVLVSVARDHYCGGAS